MSLDSSQYDLPEATSPIDSLAQTFTPNFRTSTLSPHSEHLSAKASAEQQEGLSSHTPSKGAKLSSKHYASGLLWADYFNNMLKCWEPLVEPLSFVTAYEEVSCTVVFC